MSKKPTNDLPIPTESVSDDGRSEFHVLGFNENMKIVIQVWQRNRRRALEMEVSVRELKEFIWLAVGFDCPNEEEEARKIIREAQEKGFIFED